MSQNKGKVCYTYEAALEKAVQMENDGFRNYLKAMRKLKDKQARMILKDAALDELEHKHALERALVEGTIEGEHSMDRPVSTMNLDYVLHQKELSPDADARQALAYAIHLEKNAIDFYQKMMQGCEGAPMAKLFEKLHNDETRHLQELEDMYERHFMAEN
ncbi:ferritin family protein [Geoalkalibacter halelectricus]|uniref:Ferritin family protein n=1 Tax=Geoalkalibacter halelectricus TaxID=2847045 RepID=A0ABY5ZRX8_9BACT|nr:ferritin family protein [Geoalkalibacter halelectricus]MDO3376665.1 ferritin family protein [Geoalkalibacter halelectricus]UWZ81383.1 ferritin family protein [Geoalkalibacter halelectricus]